MSLIFLFLSFRPKPLGFHQGECIFKVFLQVKPMLIPLQYVKSCSRKTWRTCRRICKRNEPINFHPEVCYLFRWADYLFVKSAQCLDSGILLLLPYAINSLIRIWTILCCVFFPFDFKCLDKKIYFSTCTLVPHKERSGKCYSLVVKRNSLVIWVFRTLCNYFSQRSLALQKNILNSFLLQYRNIVVLYFEKSIAHPLPKKMHDPNFIIKLKPCCFRALRWRKTSVHKTEWEQISRLSTNHGTHWVVHELPRCVFN